MTPEQIVEDAAAAGMVLYVQDGTLRYFGVRPADWYALSEQWLPYRSQVVRYLEAPTWVHRVRIAKATATQSRAVSGVPCRYRGLLLEAKPACGCGPRHGCEKYGECVLSGTGGGRWRVCTRCHDYSALGDE